MASSFSKSDNCGGKSVTKSRFKETNTKRRPNKKKDSKNRVSNIVCISPISNFKEKVSEAKNLLWSLNQVIITAVGPSIPHAINLAMILQSTNAVAIETSTSTVHHSGTDYFNQKEFSSPSIRIRVDLLGEKKNQTNKPSTMFFTMKEITKWLGITVFEILVWLLSLIVTCVLVLLRIEWNLLQDRSWWLIIGPIFFADVLNAYFCIIVFIRMYLNGALKPAALRVLWSVFVLGLGFVFKFLLCRKLESQPGPSLEFSAVLAPVFILIQLIIMRACNMN